MSHDCSTTRRLFMVLSPRSLPYARLALESLFRNCVEDFSLYLITDSKDDVNSLTSELAQLHSPKGGLSRDLRIIGEADLADIGQDKFGKYPHIRKFRQGHPCWRKITDPVLLSDDKAEVIVLDPDLYFPNRFRFEPTLKSGILLMWQRPSCLLPAEVVELALNANVALAHHTDIGVAQWRLPVDLDWLDWFIAIIGSSQLPKSMHVESIVWAALAMRLGGGYLDPGKWLCWHRSQIKRVLVRMRTPGTSILKSEPFARIKCFHAGGEAKWWVVDAHRLGMLDFNEDMTALSRPTPYQQLTPSDYHSLQRSKRWLRKLGYYSVFGN
jgi:hypothetical protein